jgi:hypothetical protein
MKLTNKQIELLDQLKEKKVMEWCFYGKSPTQFNIKTAQALHKKGLVNLENVTKPFPENQTDSIQYKLTLK